MTKLLFLLCLAFFGVFNSAIQAKKCLFDIPDAVKEQRYIEFDAYYRRYMDEVMGILKK